MMHYENNIWEETSIQELVDKRIYPQWVLEMGRFLKELNIMFIIVGDRDETEFNILNVPRDLIEIVHEKCKELLLIFHIHETGRIIYEGNPITNPQKDIAGITKEGISFSIREALYGENIDEISITREIKDY